jgi:preprotein translocase subunit SecG
MVAIAADPGDEQICNISLRWFRMIEAFARFVMGWVLVAALVGNPEHVVQKQFVGGAGSSIAIAVHCWFFVPYTLRAVYRALDPIANGDAVWRDNQGRWNRPAITDVGVVCAIFTVSTIYWMGEFGTYSSHLDERRTVWRCFCATAVCCALWETRDGILGGLRLEWRSLAQAVVFARAGLVSLFPMCLTYYDRVPRSRLGTEPNVLLLVAIILCGAALLAHEYNGFVRRFGKLTCYAEEMDLLHAERELTRIVAVTMFAFFLVAWLLTYQQSYKEMRDTCDVYGLPAYVRYNGTTPTLPEQLLACTHKCDTGINGLDDCMGDYASRCCNRITAIFSFGESYTVRHQFILYLVLYALVLGTPDAVTEAVYCAKQTSCVSGPQGAVKKWKSEDTGVTWGYDKNVQEPRLRPDLEEEPLVVPPVPPPPPIDDPPGWPFHVVPPPPKEDPPGKPVRSEPLPEIPSKKEHPNFPFNRSQEQTEEEEEEEWDPRPEYTVSTSERRPVNSTRSRYGRR